MLQSYSKPTFIKTILSDFVSLIYPRVCIGCNAVLLHHENTLCTYCHLLLPHTHYEQQEDNPVARLFWNKLKVHHASAAYFFSKRSRIQRIIHAFKYRNHPEVARYMGQLMGAKLTSLHQDTPIHGIIPIPLHPIKKRLRGYNQAQLLSEGIGQLLDIPILTKSLFRITANPTQTNKSIYDRYTNVHSIFLTKSNKSLKGSHILLVDDVITSGSTIAAAARSFSDTTPPQLISIAALAIANG